MVFHYLGGKCYQLPEIKESFALFLASFPLCCWNCILELDEGNYYMAEKHLKIEPSEEEVSGGNKSIKGAQTAPGSAPFRFSKNLMWTSVGMKVGLSSCSLSCVREEKKIGALCL